MSSIASIIPSCNYACPQTQPWPNGAQLVISLSMQLETGGHERVSENPFSSANPIPPEYPDLAAETWFRYGANEGVHRLLAIWDKYGVKTLDVGEERQIAGADTRQFSQYLFNMRKRYEELKPRKFKSWNIYGGIVVRRTE